MKLMTENELATRTAMHNKQDFEKKKRRAWRRNPMRRSLQPVQASKSMPDLHAITDVRDEASSLTTHATEKDLRSVPKRIAKDLNGPLTGRSPGSKKSIILTPYSNEMGDAQGVTKKSRATRQERGRYCKSSYWKQKVYNLNYSRMQKTRPFVQVWMGCWGQGLFNFFLSRFFFIILFAAGIDGEII